MGTRLSKFPFAILILILLMPETNFMFSQETVSVDTYKEKQKNFNQENIENANMEDSNNAKNEALTEESYAKKQQNEEQESIFVNKSYTFNELPQNHQAYQELINLKNKSSEKIEFHFEKCKKLPRTTCIAHWPNFTLFHLQQNDSIKSKEFSNLITKKMNALVFILAFIISFGKLKNSKLKEFLCLNLRKFHFTDLLLNTEKFFNFFITQKAYWKSYKFDESSSLKYNLEKSSYSAVWLHNHWFEKCCEYFVYPVFSMQRTATYGPLICIDSPVSFIQLSDAGFSYTGQGNVIRCDSCSKTHDFMSITSSPIHSMYHNASCEYIKNDLTTSESSELNAQASDESTAIFSETGECSIANYCIRPLNPSIDENDISYQQEDGGNSHCIGHHQLKQSEYIFLESIKSNSLTLLSNDEIMHKIILNCSKLTVKVECKKNNSTGSGNILNYPSKIIPHQKLQGLSNLNNDLKKMVESCTEIGIVYVQTASHVVKKSENYINDIEVNLALDSSGNIEDIKLRGCFILHHKEPQVANSIVVCFTPDLNTVKAINNLQRETASLLRKVPDRIAQNLSEYVFIVALHRGKDKLLSIGKNVKYRKSSPPDKHNLTYEAAPELEALQYKALTCAGSSGAPVIRFTKVHSEWELDIWTHNGITTTERMGITVKREISHKERSSMASARALLSENDTSQHNVKPSETATNVTNVAMPGTVMQRLPSPTYPAYLELQKRIESFTNWKISHIISLNRLAEAGFFYAGYNDCVRCFCCGVGLKSWKLGDDVDREHEKFRPSCLFLQQRLANMRKNSSDSQECLQVKLLKKENDMLQGLLKCKVCNEAPVKDLFLPCGDLYACSGCSQKLNHCPICQKKILGTVTTYFT